MKVLSRQTFLGQQGINLVEKSVQSMGYWWYPTTIPEVGIDGHIEIRDPATGRMTNLIIQVQSKATERKWPHEDDDTFEYICEESDLEYWLAGNAPVVIVFSRPSTAEAYWVSIKDYFQARPDARRARKISIIKSKSRFDSNAAASLLRIAAPVTSGTYLSPRPKPELLFSNLLQVEFYSPDLFIARTELRDPKDLWRIAQGLELQIGSEWALHNRNLVSFHDLSRAPWPQFCEVGTLEQFETTDWAESEDDDRRKIFVQLLGRALTQRLREWRVWRRKEDGVYHFGASKIFRPRRVDFEGESNEQFRTVVQQYQSGRSKYFRHNAFKGYFKNYDRSWYLEITPTYVFTRDGYQVSRYEADLLSGIKQLEHNDTLLAQVLLWKDILTRRADLFHTDYPFLRFSDLKCFDLRFGINDREWLSREELDVSERGLSALENMGLFQ